MRTRIYGMSARIAGRCISAHREVCSGKQAGQSARDVAKSNPLLLQPRTTAEAVKAKILEDLVLFLGQTGKWKLGRLRFFHPQRPVDEQGLPIRLAVTGTVRLRSR